MLVRVRKKIKTPTQNPSTATTTRRVPGGVGGVVVVAGGTTVSLV